jgi:hypothetical protein
LDPAIAAGPASYEVTTLAVAVSICGQHVRSGSQSLSRPRALARVTVTEQRRQIGVVLFFHALVVP